MDKATLKHILISVLIGALVSFLTTLLQGILGILTHWNEITGPTSGAGAYLYQVWKTNRLI